MVDCVQSKQFEAWIKARSYAIWERDGRRNGRAMQHWLRAQNEIEQAWQTAIDGDTSGVVPPQVTVSERPVRRDSFACSGTSERLAA